MNEAIAYAEKHRMMIPETHNEKNLKFYQQFGFKLYGVLKKNFPLKQYCLIREVEVNQNTPLLTYCVCTVLKKAGVIPVSCVTPNRVQISCYH